MKKVLSFVLVFLFCFGAFSALSFGNADEHDHDHDDCGHVHYSNVITASAAGRVEDDPDDPDNPDTPHTPDDQIKVKEPTFLFYNIGPLSEDGSSHSRTEAVVNASSRTVTFNIIVKATGDCMGLQHCREGKITLTYDPSIFSFTSGSGTLMYQNYETLYIEEGIGSITIETFSDYNETYIIEADLNLELSFEDINLDRIDDFSKSFTIEFSCSSSLYDKSPYSEKKTVTAMICPHDITKEVKVDATCVDTEHVDTVCQRCGRVVFTKYTNMYLADHTYDYNDIVRVLNVSSLGDCKTTGVTVEYKCRVCGKLQRATDMEYHVGLNTNNKFYDETTKQYFYYCANGHKVIAKIQAADIEECAENEHNYTELSRTPATCTKEGEVVYRCSKCGKIKTETIAKIAHTYQTWTTLKEATCLEEGSRTAKCTVCGEETTEKIPKGEHKFGEWTTIKEPTCTESGLHEHTCTVCNTEKQVAEIPALGHSFGEEVITKAATCASDGEAVKVCTRCGEEEKRVIPKDESLHKYGEWVTTTPATCVTEGVQTRTCTVCGKTESKNIGLGTHNYVKTVVSELSCYEDSLVRYTCEYCNDSYEETQKCEGHVFEMLAPNENTTIRRCKNCGLEIKTVKNGNKTEKIITCGVFVLRVGEKYLNSDIWLRADEVKRGSEEFKFDEQNTASLYLGSKAHAIQNAYKVKVYVNGEQVKFDADMTLTLALDSALKNRSTEIVYFENVGSSVMITRMKDAKRSGLEYKVPANLLANSYNDTVILTVEGEYATPNGDAKPNSESSRGNVIIPIVIVGVAIVIAVTAAVLVLKKGKSTKKFDI
ncbi:MAG: hypothetical protein IJQ37_07050 [Clostridia bacterium]|nr:hypothetical protein [Clostridia bacterium]